MGEAEEWERLRKAALKCRNWGRWEPDDQLGTHWDALAHIIWEGKIYNGYDCTLVISAGRRKTAFRP